MKKLISLLAIVSLLGACHTTTRNDIMEKGKELNLKAGNINHAFLTVRHEVDRLAHEIKDLYLLKDSILPTIEKDKYQLAANGVFFKQVDDGGSAMFVSGYYPVDEQIKEVVYFTEPIDTAFINLINRYPEVVQVYYNDRFSINRIYPYFDVLSQYEPKMNIPAFNFYYLADAEHNPERKSLWLNEPYVDPAGRGWMVSAIAPVYVDGQLEGVPGIDVTINDLTKKYILDNPESMTMIIDNTGTIVTAQEATINLLSFPPLFDHKYIETIKQDTYRKEMYSFTLSKEESVRKIATEILNNHKSMVEITIFGEKITVLAAHIPELDWYLLELVK